MVHSGIEGGRSAGVRMARRGTVEPSEAGGRAMGSSGPRDEETRQARDGDPPLRGGNIEGLTRHKDDWTAEVAE